MSPASLKCLLLPPPLPLPPFKVIEPCIEEVTSTFATLKSTLKAVKAQASAAAAAAAAACGLQPEPAAAADAEGSQAEAGEKVQGRKKAKYIEVALEGR